MLKRRVYKKVRRMMKVMCMPKTEVLEISVDWNDLEKFLRNFKTI